MADPVSVPVLYDKGVYAADLVKSPAKGRFAGEIIYWPDELIFEAWRYLTKGPTLIGSARTAPEALKFFYQRADIPKPSIGWCIQVIKLGKFEETQTVRCVGSRRKCDCYDDGLADSHPHFCASYKYESITRKIKRL